MDEHRESKSSRAFGQERKHKTAHRLCVAVFFVLSASCSLAQQPADVHSASVASRYPAGSISSVEQADQALGEIEKERAEIDARFVMDEQVCHPQFFATSCVEQAKERRRKARMQLRPIEIEARTYKRQLRVNARDAALAERQEKNAGSKAVHDHGQQGGARVPDSAPRVETTPGAASDAAGKLQTTIFPKRSQEHPVKAKQKQADESALAKKRAENIAAYERKVQQAQQRQREVAERKAEKEQKRRTKDEPSGVR